MYFSNNITYNSTESNNDHNHDVDDHNDIPSTFTFILYFVMSVFICFGNTSTLIAIVRNHKLRTITNIYIGSLAVADLMVGIMLLVQGISELNANHRFVEYEEEFCLARMSMLFVSVAASLLSYLLVTCDRYMYIMHSLKYAQLVTKQRSMVCILLAWILAVIYGTVPAYTSHFTLDEGCTPTHVFSFAYMIIVHPIFFLSLGGITLCLYFKIALTAVQQQRRIRNQEVGFQEQLGQTKVSQRTWKVVKLLMLVFGFFFTCWCPLLIFGFLEYTIHVDHLPLSIASLVAIMNSGVNFLVLAAMNSDFRETFKRIFCVWCGEMCCCCGSVKVQTISVSAIGTSHWAQ